MKTLFFFIIILCSHLSTIAQNGYKTLQDCNNDTLVYAITNFEHNKERYIGQTMETFLNELEFKIMRFFPTNHLPNNPQKSYIHGIIIFADSDDTFAQKDYNHQKRFNIHIYFDVPPYKDKATTIYEMRREDKEWGSKYYDIFKNYKIESISVSVFE